MTSGTIGPRMLVNNDITKNVRKTRETIERLLAINSTSKDDLVQVPFASCVTPPRGSRSLEPEPVMPDTRGANEVGVLSQ